MSVFDYFRKSPTAAKADTAKLEADNQMALAGLQALAAQVKSQATQTNDEPGLTTEEYLARLRQEGKGR